MKTSLFKKEITKKEAGKIAGGVDTPTSGEMATIGMRKTLRYVIPWGGVRDDHSASDTEPFTDNI